MSTANVLPNFLIIGAAKAGTTALFEILNSHPQVFLAFNKETMFFSNDANYRQGPDWYSRTYFKNAARYPARGEATPHYLYWSEKAAPRIRDTFDGSPIKLIAIFRDPVMRAYSWYWNMVKEGREDLPFQQAIEQESHRRHENENKLKPPGWMTYGYVHGSNYAQLLAPFLERFPRQDFLFLLQEDLISDRASVQRSLQDFLCLDEKISEKAVVRNQAVQPRSHRLQAILRKPTPLRNFLKDHLPIKFRHFLISNLLLLNSRPVQYPRLDPALEADLRQQFAPGVLQLQELIDRDLSAWLP